jgi:hypothetical protein
MAPNLSLLEILSVAVPVGGILLAVFPRRLSNPRSRFSYYVDELTDEYKDEVEQLGKVTLQVAVKAGQQTDSDGISKVESRAAAKVIRGAFDDHYVEEDDDLYEGVENDIAQQQQSVKSKLTVLNRVNRLFWLSKGIRKMWWGLAIVGAGSLVLIVLKLVETGTSSGVPLVPMALITLVQLVLFVAVLILSLYLTGASWYALDVILSWQLRKEGLYPDKNDETSDVQTRQHDSDDGGD